MKVSLHVRCTYLFLNTVVWLWVENCSPTSVRNTYFARPLQAILGVWFSDWSRLFLLYSFISSAAGEQRAHVRGIKHQWGVVSQSWKVVCVICGYVWSDVAGVDVNTEKACCIQIINGFLFLNSVLTPTVIGTTYSQLKYLNRQKKQTLVHSCESYISLLFQKACYRQLSFLPLVVMLCRCDFI